jgi:hypothetical protein
MAECEHGIRRQTCSVCKPELVFAEYERKAGLRNLIFRLTLSEFIEITQDRCVYCGTYEAGGIDRRDNRIGYIRQNCFSCCGPCNFLKGRMEHYKFLALVKRICDYQSELEQVRSRDKNQFIPDNRNGVEQCRRNTPALS